MQIYLFELCFLYFLCVWTSTFFLPTLHVSRHTHSRHTQMELPFQGEVHHHNNMPIRGYLQQISLTQIQFYRSLSHNKKNRFPKTQEVNKTSKNMEFSVKSRVEDDAQSKDQISDKLDELLARLVTDTSEAQIADVQVERLLLDFMGDKNSRLSKRGPKEGSRDLMREVIRGYVSANSPIPVLIVASACKLPLHGHGADIAEVLFVRMLIDLQIKMKSIFAPGVKFIVRFEDLTLMVLFPELTDLQKKTQEYIEAFRQIISMMKADHFIAIRPESHMMSTYQFMLKARQASELFHRYILATDAIGPLPSEIDIQEAGSPYDEFDSRDTHAAEDDEQYARRVGGVALELLNSLQALGWKGGVSYELRTWLRTRYTKLYASQNPEDREEAMCRYLGCIPTRRELNGVGCFPAETPFGRLEIGLVPPLPDTPEISTRVYYRSFPLVLSKSKAPFWRCKAIARPHARTATACVTTSDLPNLEFSIVEFGDRDITLAAEARDADSFPDIHQYRGVISILRNKPVDLSVTIVN